jgi:hypothetical protein
MSEGVVQSSGCGWYFHLASLFNLDRERVAGLALDLSNAFPLVHGSGKKGHAPPA